MVALAFTSMKSMCFVLRLRSGPRPNLAVRKTPRCVAPSVIWLIVWKIRGENVRSSADVLGVVETITTLDAVVTASCVASCEKSRS